MINFQENAEPVVTAKCPEHYQISTRLLNHFFLIVNEISISTVNHDNVFFTSTIRMNLYLLLCLRLIV